MTVELTPLLAGEISSPAAWIYGLPRAREPSVSLPILAFLLRHPQHGPIVVDSGLHRRAIDDPRGEFGRFNGAIFRSLRPAGQPFDEQLRGERVEPEDVRLAVMTHLHADHTSGMRLLPNAEFACSGAEWTAATSRRAVLAGYVGAHLPHPSRVRQLDLGEEPLDLLGDGSVRLMSTPGHSRGHLSLLVQARRGPVLLVGDALYTMRNLDENILPMRSVDAKLMQRSMDGLREFRAAHPDVLFVPTHDPEAWRALQA